MEDNIVQCWSNVRSLLVGRKIFMTTCTHSYLDLFDEFVDVFFSVCSPRWIGVSPRHQYENFDFNYFQFCPQS